MTNCNATCCRQGVLLDVREKEKILQLADLVKKYMDPHQEQDTGRWFGDEMEDVDFPSGRCVATEVKSYGCVFLDARGRCVLQKAALAEGMPKYSLKPFFCVTYPVTIQDGEIIIDDPDFTYRTECCSTVENGELSVFDVCREEIGFMLGEQGLKELQELAGDSSGRA